MNGVEIDETFIRFPYEPYDVQKLYMQKVLESLKNKSFALLESPTGTGKTLALLCASLAWLESERGRAPVGSIDGPDADIKALLDPNFEGPNAGAWGGGQGNGLKAKCRIVYASRTHSQLAQVIQEFRNSPYKHVSSVILASRDQLCINEQLATTSDKNQMCRAKIKTRTCEYYNNIERRAGNATNCNDLNVGGESNAGDIESLRKNGHRRKLCPYYASREMAANADLVFLPYNYLVDPRIRKTLAINLEECAVIVDEAHNVLKIFEDSSSISFKGKDVAVALKDLDYMLQIVEDENLASNIESMPNVDTSQVYALKDCFEKFDRCLIDFEKTIKANSNSEQDFPGDKIVELFNESGINSGSAGAICLAITNVLDCLSVLNLSGAITKGKGLQKMSEIIELLFFQNAGSSSFDTRQKMNAYYKFYAEKKTTEGKIGQTDTEYNLWCFHPGFSLSSLVGCKIRTMILTSGTLKPLDHFSYELDQKFPVMLENEHVIDPKKQICYQVLTNGPESTELIGTYANSSNPKYLTSLGMAIIQIEKQVPDGLLIFFSSYRWLDLCVKHWQTYDGLWQQMNNIKECFVEPKDRNSLTKIVQEYRTRVKQSSPVGACFMAVCRGKVSEGIDFADSDARAVVITGIPFPSMYDPKVKLKKKFLDSKKIQSKGIGGAEWYNLEAFRALNQAIGRVIRHKTDFGAVLLLDKRFSNEGNASKLPSWLDKSIIESNFRKGMARLAQFYHHNKYSKVKPQAIIQQPELTIPKKTISKSDSNTVNQPPLKKKKIVLKPRNSLFKDDIENNKAGPSETNLTDIGAEKNVKPTLSTNIQDFVLLLKEKLGKPSLKKLICEIRAYKEQGTIDPLLALLKEYSTQEVITNQDIEKFRPFVRKDDESTFNAIL